MRNDAENDIHDADNFAYLDRVLETLYRVNCPDTLILSEYVAGLLPADSRPGIQKHLAACPYCVQEVANLKTYLAAVSPDLETNLFKRARVLVARLVSSAGNMGQFGTQPAFGLRGETAGPAMYAAEGLQLSLDVQENPHRPGQKRILGLIIGAETAGSQAQLWQNGRRIVTGDVDELGNFTLETPAAATYELIINDGNTSVHIPEFTVA